MVIVSGFEKEKDFFIFLNMHLVFHFVHIFKVWHVLF